MLRIFIFISLFFICQANLAQTVTGKWKTYDVFNKHKEESIVEISIKDEMLIIKIVQIIPKEHRLDSCVKCTDERKDMPIMGMTILEGAKLTDGVWKGASILHARNGKEYGCHISLEAPDLLKVRGFVGYPIFGKTLYWTRVKDNTYQ